MTITIGRREFITALGGTTIPYPIAAHTHPIETYRSAATCVDRIRGERR